MQKLFLRQTESIRKTRQKNCVDCGWLNNERTITRLWGSVISTITIYNNDRPSSIGRSEAEWRRWWRRREKLRQRLLPLWGLRGKWPRHSISIIDRFLTRIFLKKTRSYAALRAADLDWIIGPGYSSGGYILGENHEKPTWNHEKPGITEKRHWRGATTDLLDV